MFNHPSKWMWAAVLSLSAGGAYASEPSAMPTNEKKVETIVDDIRRLRHGEPDIEPRSFGSLSRADVRELQQKLKGMDLYEGEVDGVVGPLTRAAVGAFQEKENLHITGKLDEATLRELELDLDRQPVRGERTYGAGERPVRKDVDSRSGERKQADYDKTAREQRIDLRGKDRVLKVQDLDHDQRQVLHEKLRAAGFYKGDVDAQDRSETQMAVRQFQSSKNLTANGMLDRPTLEALGFDVNEIQPVRGDGDDDKVEKELKEEKREAKEELREDRKELRREMNDRDSID